MGMNVGSNNDDDVMLEVNMTPLIDVMLVLIIMFIINMYDQIHFQSIIINFMIEIFVNLFLFFIILFYDSPYSYIFYLTHLHQ